MDENLKKDAPRLFSLERKNGYHVPEGFFNELENGIHQQCNRSKKTGKLREIKRWVEVSIAAAILVIVFFSGFKIFTGKHDTPDQASRKIYNVLDGDMDGE